MIDTTMPSPQTTAATFTTGYTRYLDKNGKLVAALPAELHDPQRIVELYRAILRTRAFDEKALALQRTGRIGTYLSSLGMEAVFIGAAGAMRADDVFLPYFRDHGAMMYRGAKPESLLLYWGGDERGNSYDACLGDLPYNIPAASHSAHAAGVALAFQLRKQPRAALAIFGDGATSKGDAYESFNFAGVWKLPVVFVINDNQWAISVPRKRQSAAQTLAQKAIAAGIHGEQIDGNDVIAVHTACKAALERARGGEGASVIEALTYRLTDHSTADDASRYRSDAEVTAHWEEEPAKRLELYLTSIGVWSKSRQAHLIAGGVVFRHRLPLSITFDHRVVTGGEAARFLAAMIGSLENAGSSGS
jgi:2-oxoisovalerate dehydrogenase E1 component alpha subunit